MLGISNRLIPVRPSQRGSAVTRLAPKELWREVRPGRFLVQPTICAAVNTLNHAAALARAAVPALDNEKELQRAVENIIPILNNVFRNDRFSPLVIAVTLEPAHQWMLKAAGAFVVREFPHFRDDALIGILQRGHLMFPDFPRGVVSDAEELALWTHEELHKLLPAQGALQKRVEPLKRLLTEVMTFARTIRLEPRAGSPNVRDVAGYLEQVAVSGTPYRFPRDWTEFWIRSGDPVFLRGTKMSGYWVPTFHIREFWRALAPELRAKAPGLFAECRAGLGAMRELRQEASENAKLDFRALRRTTAAPVG